MTGTDRTSLPQRRVAAKSLLVGTLVAGIASFMVIRALAGSWSDVRNAPGDATWGWLGAATILASSAMISIACGWRYVLRLVGFKVGGVQVVSWYFLGEIGKYLPGGIWSAVGRGESARRGGVPRSSAYLSVGLSLAALYLAAMGTAVVFMPFGMRSGGFSPWVLCLLAWPIGLLGLHDRVLHRLVRLVSQLSRRPIQIQVPSWGSLLKVVVGLTPSWLLIGGSTFAVARAFSYEASIPRVMCATALAWTAGFLAVPVPTGAGVREAVFLVTSGLPGGVAAATAVTSRLIFIGVDALGAAVAAAIASRVHRPVTVLTPDLVLIGSSE